MRCAVCFRYGEDSRAPRRVLWTDVTVAERHRRRLFESAADDILMATEHLSSLLRTDSGDGVWGCGVFVSTRFAN